ncbi:sodium:solute symporter family transporter [Bryobacter aggregatus]|uniref:sodium:solute symporter family transporter n=1 Tax=Bryobacter aggregatus TaxID=360054 RepID=UPI00055BC22D|nr:hypothetical protein [Bryobacter aggregatus]
MAAMFWPVVIFMAISLCIGLYTYTQVRGSSERFTVCGKSMPFFIVGTALIAQSVDGNATLGNVSLVWSTNIWGGILIPLGLATSLIVVGRFLAAPLNEMDLMTLPEFFYRRYGKKTELLVSIITLTCFTILIAGNLSAVAWILSVVSGMSYGTSLLIATTVIVTYTMAGGLFSAIWTDIFQVHVALIGFIAGAAWLVYHYGTAPLDAAIAAGKLDLKPLSQLSGGALPNWANFISLAIGNTMALDFMERVFSAKSGRTAKNACYYAAILTLIVGGCATLMGLYAVSLVPNAENPRMVLPTLANGILPFGLGVMVFIGVLGASMSSSNGGMIVMSVVAARNLFERYRAVPVTDSQMLMWSRLMAIPTAILAGLTAYFKPEPGILLVIAFDIVFAGCVVPLIFGVHSKKATAEAAVTAIVTGTVSRLIAHFATPPEWAGLDTLLPPVLSLIAFVTVVKLAAPKELPQAVVAHGD